MRESCGRIEDVEITCDGIIVNVMFSFELPKNKWEKGDLVYLRKY